MPLTALLLGDPARLAFPGHLRLSLDHGPVGVAVAARVGAGETLEAAWMASRALESALRAGLAAPVADRHALLHALWAAVAAVPEAPLGPARGGDLTLLAVAWDSDGVGVAGVGLAAAWARTSAGLFALVDAGHPLLAPCGRPSSPPGVLTLDEGVATSAIVGCPRHLDGAPPPAPAELDRRCGVRP